jgi:hypothetical protein
MRTFSTFAAAILVAATSFASERPTGFRLEDVTVTMLEQPRWPVGFSKEIVVRSDSVAVSSTPLPCEPCVASKQLYPTKDEEFLSLLGKLHRSGFFDASAEYSSGKAYVLDQNGMVTETDVVTTDENRIILRVRIGAWTKEILDDGEAPLGIRELENAVFVLARAKRQ